MIKLKLKSANFFILIFFTWPLKDKVNSETIDLSKYQWLFWSANGTIRGNASIPSDIYSDLLNNEIIDQPLFGENDQKLRWVAATDWVYQCNFTVPLHWTKYTTTHSLSAYDEKYNHSTFCLTSFSTISQKLVKERGRMVENEYAAVILKVNGLDTVADLWVNEYLILRSVNQFVSYLIEFEVWKPGSNNLTIKFESPVKYAERQAASYHYSHFYNIPPDCPPNVYHGECHANFIRKMQSSFGWDWGPSFPAVGIWQPLKIEGFNKVYVDDVSATVKKIDDKFLVTVELKVFSAINDDSVQIMVSIPELLIWGTSKTFVLGMQENSLSTFFEVSAAAVDLWWPLGYGKARLYDLRIQIDVGGEIIDAKLLKLGFRTVFLNQSHVDVSHIEKGRNFFFEVNDIPIFLKGSNWIPISSFPAQNHSERLHFLFDSVAEANMNTLRIWGGGRYESDEFYDLADQKGILLWHDFMFACALYPTDTPFLLNVRKEITQQVWKLRHHPSIFVWAGNNENEIAIASNWYPSSNYDRAKKVHDYMRLFNDTVKASVIGLDDTRPFLLSSPSNGLETELEGGVSRNPADQRFGDIHFYNDFVNLWKDYTYQAPRCATEFGVQSLPKKETMIHWLFDSDWSLTSRTFLGREHHPGGILSLFVVVFSHFKMPYGCSDINALHECEQAINGSFLDRFTYYTQMHQAIAYQIQTEHYRRWRGLLDENGMGNTMCAMYWQLNDVWAAPSWSSIDFDLSWKPLHYAAKRFFADVIVSAFLNREKSLEVFIVSDLTKALRECNLTIAMLALTAGFEPVYKLQKTVDVLPSASMKVDLNDVILKKRQVSSGEEDYLIRSRLYSSDGKQIGFDSILIPDQLFQVDEKAFGTVAIKSFEKINSLQYRIELFSDRIAIFVWLQVAKPVLGWFSDNAFTMTEPCKRVNLTLWKPDYFLRKDDVKVCSLADCGLSLH